MESGVDFVATDCPNDDRFMLHIRAAIAEDEARKVSQRTRGPPAFPAGTLVWSRAGRVRISALLARCS
jgi:hypothetical protein